MNTMYDVESYEHAWLGLNKEDISGIGNPFTNLTDEQKNNNTEPRNNIWID